MHSPKRRLRRRRRKPMKMKSEESTDMATHGDCCCCCYSYCCTGVQISAAVLDRLRLFGRRDVRAPVGGASRVGRPTRLQGPRPPLSPSLQEQQRVGSNTNIPRANSSDFTTSRLGCLSRPSLSTR